MARIRTIKPDFWTDDAVAQLSPTAMLLFIGMWNFADDEGYLRDSVGQLRRQIFPDRGWDVESALAELLILGRVTRMDSDQGPLLHVPHMTEHQKIDRPTKTKYTHVRPQGTPIVEDSRGLDEDSRDASTARESSRRKEGRKEGNGEEGKGSAADAEPPLRCSDHLTSTTPPRCGRCKDARVAHEQWERQHAVAPSSRPAPWSPETHCEHGQLHGKCDACDQEARHASNVLRARFGDVA